MDHKDNIEIFYDTVQKIIFNNDLLEIIDESTKNQQIYVGDYIIEYENIKYESPANIVISNNGSFDAALKYKNPAVLNFASSVSPGGGVLKGSNAQEETLCRCSTLYFNLTDKKCIEKFYSAHKKENNYLNFDDIIYTPNVQILKTNDYKDLSNVRSCGVITCAAPQLKSINIPVEYLYNIHIQRGRKILDVALKNGHDSIILGAFGCGAFNNNPHIVACAYKQLVEEYKYKFKTIEFAIYSPNVESENLKAFKNVFEK